MERRASRPSIILEPGGNARLLHSRLSLCALLGSVASKGWGWWAVQDSFLVVSTQLHALIPKDLLCTDCKFAIIFGEINIRSPVAFV
jgi:hypothetical protein